MDLKKQNEAHALILKAMETAVYGIKAPDDDLKSKEYLERLHSDLEVILNLHQNKIHLEEGCAFMQAQNDKLYKRVKEAENA